MTANNISNRIATNGEHKAITGTPELDRRGLFAMDHEAPARRAKLGCRARPCLGGVHAVDIWGLAFRGQASAKAKHNARGLPGQAVP